MKESIWNSITTSKAGEKVENEFNENWIKLDSDFFANKIAASAVPQNEIRKTFNGAVKCIYPDSDGKESEFYIAAYSGGMNGGELENRWSRYFDDMSDIMKRLGSSWLIFLDNDCPDDIWYLVVAFTAKNETPKTAEHTIIFETKENLMKSVKKIKKNK